MSTTGPVTDDLRRADFCSECGTPAAGGSFCARCGAELQLVRRIDLDAAAEAPTIVLPPAALPQQRVAEPASPAGEALIAEAPLVAGGDDGRWRRLPRRSRALVVGSALVVVVGLVAASLALVSWLGDRDVRQALSTAQPQYRAVVAALAAADDVDGVVGAARRAGPATAVLTEQSVALRSRDDAYGRAARAQLEAEVAVLRSLTGLAGVQDTPLDSWSTAQPVLVTALAEEAEARDDLARHDDGAVSGLPDADGLMAGTTRTLAPVLASDAASRARQLLGSLSGATTTGQLRDLAGPASAQQQAVAAAAATLPDGREKSALAGLADGLGGLGGLAEVSGRSPGSWQSSRGAIATGFAAVAAGSGDGAVTSALDTALATGDRVVGEAAAAIADWQARTKAATQTRDADAQALRQYADAFRTELSRYTQLRNDLQDFTARVEDPTSIVTAYDGFQYMSAAADDRREILDTLNGLTVPTDVRDAHADVVGVVDRAVRAVTTGYEGLAQWWYCSDCAYSDTPGWTTFQSESEAITGAFGTAAQSWDAAVAAAEAAITNRALPAEPVV